MKVNYATKPWIPTYNLRRLMAERDYVKSVACDVEPALREQLNNYHRPKT